MNKQRNNVITKQNKIMSQKRKAQRARRAAQEEKQAQNVIKWIFAALVFLALLMVCVFFFN